MRGVLQEFHGLPYSDFKLLSVVGIKFIATWSRTVDVSAHAEIVRSEVACVRVHMGVHGNTVLENIHHILKNA